MLKEKRAVDDRIKHVEACDRLFEKLEEFGLVDPTDIVMTWYLMTICCLTRSSFCSRVKLTCSELILRRPVRWDLVEYLLTTPTKPT